MTAVPIVYAPRRTVLEPTIAMIAARVRALDYRHVRAGVTTFAGALDAKRPSTSSICSTSA